MSTLSNEVNSSSSGKKQKFDAINFFNKNKEALIEKPSPDINKTVYSLPLSSEQQKIWFQQQMAPHPYAFNIATGIVVTGTLNQTYLEQSLQAIIQRQQTLKTTYFSVDGNTVQKVSDQVNLAWQTKDFSHFSYIQAKEELNKLIFEQARKPFDIEKGPLVQPFLVCMAKTEHILLLFMHRLIFDNSSIPVLLQELAETYHSFQSHTSLTIPDLPLQYMDYARWQQEYSKQPLQNKQAGYWKTQLEGDLPILELPADKLRPAVQRFTGATHTFRLSDKVHAGVKSLAEFSGVSVCDVLLSCFYTLLYRYTGQEDIIIGYPVTNRQQKGTENLIGAFDSTLPLRQQINVDATFAELLQVTHATVKNAVQHQSIPFENTAQENIPGQIKSNPLVYQVLFQLEKENIAPVQVQSLTFEKYPVHTDIIDGDLFLTIQEKEDGFTCLLSYDVDLFNAGTIERMATHYATLTENAVSDASQKIARLNILPEAERNLLLVEWNQTKVSYPADKCVHQLFEEQADKTPEAIAIVFEDTQLTYRQLNEKANQLAHYLQSKGVGSETMVGICVERSLELIIGLLGIIKAGGAFVPLDTNYPKERLLFMLEDTGVNLLLTQKKLENYFPGIVSQTLLLDEEWQEIARFATTNPQINVQADNLLYVMYTSGSTGKPKGVSTLHKGVVRLVKNTNYAHLDENEVLLQYAPVTFDASTLEIWGSLLTGGKLIIMPSGATTLEELKYVIKKHQVTTLWLSAGLFHLMIDNGIEELTSLRQLLAGGEALSINHVRKVYHQLKNCKIINGYGPTENTTFTCCYQVTEKGLSRNSVPIGRPINNTTVYILDKYMQPVPLGIAGELYTGGDGLARNYLNRPDLTGEKFLPDPFAATPDAYMYKTGDLVRYLPDGNIEFLGRIDTQVKIRGFRIELGEIEAVLGKHPQVKESVVIVREDIPGDKRIVAYVVPKTREEIDAVQLQAYLKKQMPAFMIPSAFVALEYLPLTVNGKVNKKALPEPSLTVYTKENYVAPSTPAEQLLAQIWAQILGLATVSIEDNFFELGGHSLLAVKLFTEIRNKTGKELPISALYANPVIAKLARYIDSENNADVWQSLVPIRPGETKLPVYFIHHGGGNLEYAQRLALFLDKDQPVYGLQPIGLNGIDQPLESVEQMADYYISLITAHQPEGPYHLAGYSTGGFIAYDIAKKLSSQGKKVGNLIILDTYPNYTRFAYHGLAIRYILQSLVLLATSYKNLQHFYQTKSPGVYSRRIKDKIKAVNKMLIPAGKVASIDSNVRAKFLSISTNAEKNYQTKPYPGPLVFIRAIENHAQYVRNSDFGWKKFIQGKLAIYNVPGTHHNLFDSEANAKNIACIVQKHLNESNSIIT